MKVLIVDDDPWVRTILTDILEFEGISALAAPDGPSALTQVTACPEVDAILMDYHMPGMDGVTAIRSLQDMRQLRHARIFLMSAEWPAQHLAEQLGIPFIRKPFDIPQMLEWLRAPDAASSKGYSRRKTRSEPAEESTESADTHPHARSSDSDHERGGSLQVA